MSVLKRLGNVARGKMLEVGRTFSGDSAGSGSDPEDRPDLDDGDDPVRDPDRAPRRPPASDLDRRALLERMREEGLLTDAEVAEKLASLDAPPSPPVARKRTL